MERWKKLGSEEEGGKAEGKRREWHGLPPTSRTLVEKSRRKTNSQNTFRTMIMTQYLVFLKELPWSLF